MYCYFCGSKLDKNEKYCLECGTSKELTKKLIKKEAERRGIKEGEILRETEEEARRREAVEKRRQEAEAAAEKLRKEAEAAAEKRSERKETREDLIDILWDDGQTLPIWFASTMTTTICSSYSYSSLFVNHNSPLNQQHHDELNTYISAMSDEELEASLMKFNLLEEDQQNKDNYSK